MKIIKHPYAALAAKKDHTPKLKTIRGFDTRAEAQDYASSHKHGGMILERVLQDDEPEDEPEVKRITFGVTELVSDEGDLKRITIRELIAAKICAGIVASGQDATYAARAAHAVRQTDALIDALNKTKSDDN